MNIILCAGKNGRAIVFGRVDSEPVPGEPVTLHDARMILYWAGNRGLFGVASEGPHPDSRISPAVEQTTATVWTEWIAVSDAAADAIKGWES